MRKQGCRRFGIFEEDQLALADWFTHSQILEYRFHQARFDPLE